MRFDAKKETERIIGFIQDYYKKNNLGGAIIGISGGKDSGVVAALFTKALGKENVIGVTLPCHSKVEDQVDAKLVSDYYGFPLYNLDLTNTFDVFEKEVDLLGTFTNEQKENSRINIKPRLRMASLYYLAALYSSVYQKTYLVAGTSNKCELFVGYFTKGGDSVHDISVLADLTVEEVLQIGEVLQVPKKVLYKTPADGLSKYSDEEKLGVTYREIAMYMEDPEQLEEEIRQKIEKLHEQNRHKFYIPTYQKGE